MFLKKNKYKSILDVITIKNRFIMDFIHIHHMNLTKKRKLTLSHH